MVLSAEERARINRRSAARSTGPRSLEGRRRASLNAYIHGMRAETTVLPNESPAAFAALRDDWVGHYQPRTPGMKALVDRALMATVHQQRSTTYLTSALTQQMAAAEIRFDPATVAGECLLTVCKPDHMPPRGMKQRSAAHAADTRDDDIVAIHRSAASMRVCYPTTCARSAGSSMPQASRRSSQADDNRPRCSTR